MGIPTAMMIARAVAAVALEVERLVLQTISRRIMMQPVTRLWILWHGKVFVRILAAS
jgi:hypothetical protein